jgi:hypothetical protein
MASGHVNRTQRPNTWLHRPSLRREDSPCQLGAVHTWPKADIEIAPKDVRFQGKSGHRELTPSCPLVTIYRGLTLRKKAFGIQKRG